jgi:hypothetical protein
MKKYENEQEEILETVQEGTKKKGKKKEHKK